MPELPEVETVKRDLERVVAGQRFDEICVRDDRVIKDISKSVFVKKMTNRVVESINRRGKALVFELDNARFMIVQLKMTGWFEIRSPGNKQKCISNDVKVVFKLSNGWILNYNDQRTLGWLILADDLKEVPYLKALGPEPLKGAFTVDWLNSALKKRKAPIKTLLMNHQFLAGIGNIYASEICFGAGISPQRTADRLRGRDIERLHQTTIDVLLEAIKCRGTSMRDYRDVKGEKGTFLNRIKVYGRDGQECLNCRQEITRIVQSGRSTFYCKNCQR